MERLHLAVALPIEVPPAGPVRDEVQVAGRAPRGLEDRLLARPAGDLPHVLEGGVIREVRRRRPRIPSQGIHGRSHSSQQSIEPSGEILRRGVEVAARADRSAGSADPSGGIATNSFVTPEGSSGSGWRSRTQISHRPSGVMRPSAYRSRPPDSGGDRHRIGAELLSVEPLIGEVGEERRASVDQVGATAVLVDGRPDVEPRRGDLDRLGERGRAHEHRSSALGRPAFQPVHGAVLEPAAARA